ncbi:hypothetical protein JTB14_033082 [Gonioctena quinquepunctata]|nr:hypothetical protein JTB14_033082 [Gonioctena quinquepunctata]
MEWMLLPASEPKKTIIKAQTKATASERDRTTKPPHWWNEKIAEKRKKCTTQKELKKLIERSKRAHCTELCQKLDDDIWGDGYQIVVKHLSKQTLPCKLKVETKRKLAKKS